VTLAKTIAHFFPDFSTWLAQITDTRDQDAITYSRQFLTWMVLMGFLLKLGSRRRIAFELDTPQGLANLNTLAGARQEAVAHSDTLNHFLSHVPTRALEDLRRHMVQRLIRMKVLDYARLYGHLLVVIDGTGQLHFPERHCAQCLERIVNGQTHYYHQVLEAKLVTPDGLAISLGSEFIENADPKASKQDCELKAFQRLAQCLKKDFPQLSLCLLFDALYANGNVMHICQENHWKYFITFKEGSLPALWQEYQSLRELCPQNRRELTTPQGAHQEFSWVENLEHLDDRKRRHRLGAFQCRETKPHDKDPAKATLFAWLTNFTLGPQNIADLTNRGGRCRWKIENQGFNIQKNGGFNLEHAYSTGQRQIKNFYLLLQIAHLLTQLMERGSLLAQDAKRLFGSLSNLTRRLAESIRYVLIPPEALDPALAAAIQIRLNSS
jgi:hypothetical protein